MKQMRVGGFAGYGPNIIVGCMRIGDLSKSELETFIKTAMDLGANSFDQADIYGTEEHFASCLDLKNAAFRDKIIIQSKIGICDDYYDLSHGYLVKSVDAMLKRLRTDYIDTLLLHRPDILTDWERLGDALDHLARCGKISEIGVSNFNSSQIELLQKHMTRLVHVNQLQLSLTNCSLIKQNMHTNTEAADALMRDDGIYNYCLVNKIGIQTWSPLQYGTFSGTFIGNKKFKELNKKLNEIAEKYSVSPNTVALAWILTIPKDMQVITGTTNLTRLKECIQASEMVLTREEWYGLYKAAGNFLP